MRTTLLALQALTNLASAAPGPGLPEGWDLRQPRGTAAVRFSVTEDGGLRAAGERAAGFATFELGTRLAPQEGALTWGWRTATPLPAADLRDRERDDSPARVYVVFADRRTLFYTWGNLEPRGAAFRSWTGRSRHVIVLRNAGAADGTWRIERRNPFTDYRRVFRRAPPEIAAVGVALDTDQLGGTAWAEITDIVWKPVTP